MALAELPTIARADAPQRVPVVATLDFLDESTIIRFRGELDLSTRDEESVLMASAIAQENHLVVDLSEVTFLGAGTIGLLARSSAFIEAHSLTMTVRSPSPLIARLLSICLLDDLLVQPGRPRPVVLPRGGP